MKEIWRDIVGYEGLYQVSNLGRVFSIKKSIVLKPRDRRHYLAVGLYRGKKDYKTYYVHRLVAQAFIPNPNNLPQVNHKDCNRYNNSISNLEWVSVQDNIDYKYSLISQKNAFFNLVKREYGNNKEVINLIEKLENLLN